MKFRLEPITVIIAWWLILAVAFSQTAYADKVQLKEAVQFDQYLAPSLRDFAIEKIYNYICDVDEYACNKLTDIDVYVPMKPIHRNYWYKGLAAENMIAISIDSIDNHQIILHEVLHAVYDIPHIPGDKLMNAKLIYTFTCENELRAHYYNVRNLYRIIRVLKDN